MLTASSHFFKLSLRHIHQYGVLTVHFSGNFTACATNAYDLHDFKSSKYEDNFNLYRSLFTKCASAFAP